MVPILDHIFSVSLTFVNDRISLFIFHHSMFRIKPPPPFSTAVPILYYNIMFIQFIVLSYMEYRYLYYAFSMYILYTIYLLFTIHKYIMHTKPITIKLIGIFYYTYFKLMYFCSPARKHHILFIQW